PRRRKKQAWPRRPRPRLPPRRSSVKVERPHRPVHSRARGWRGGARQCRWRRRGRDRRRSMRRTPSRTPILAVRRSTSQIQPCRGPRQGAPHRSASPPAVLSTRRRTLSIPFALIPVHGRVRIADDPAAQQRHYLVDPIRDLALDSKSKLRLDLLETDPVVTRVLILVDEVDTGGRDAFP